MTFIKYLITRIHLFAQPCHRSKVPFCANTDAHITLSTEKLTAADERGNGRPLTCCYKYIEW